MVKLNDIEKKIQNYQEGSNYNVRYENNGEKRIYTIYPGEALEFIRQVVANTPPPPFLKRPNIQSNSTVEYKIEESNGVITGQSFTVKTPTSSSDFSKESPSVGGSDFWSSSIFGSGRQFSNQLSNQKKLEFGQPSNQDFSVVRSQPQFCNQDIWLCYCKPNVKRPLPDDWNRCLQCGGMFDDAGTEEAGKRQKAQFDRIRREQEENFRIGQENERRAEERLNRLANSNNSYQQEQVYSPEPQSRFIEINENNENEEKNAANFFQQQQQQITKNQELSLVVPIANLEISRFNQNKLSKNLIGSLIVLVSGIGLLAYYLRKRHTKGNYYANN